jgi:SAM-dependent methyltransferase
MPTRFSSSNGGAGHLTDRYARWRRSALGQITERLELKAVLDLLGPLQGVRVLDVGCGDGMYSVVAARGGARVTGVDLSARMLSAASARGAAEHVTADWIRADALKLPFADGTFDRVFAITLLCLVPEPVRAVREMTRVLAPGGVIVIGELHRWSLWAAQRRMAGWMGDALWRDARFWSVAGLRALMESGGVDVGRARGVAYYPPLSAAAYLVAPADRLLSRISTVGAAFVALSGVKRVASLK